MSNDRQPPRTRSSLRVRSRSSGWSIVAALAFVCVVASDRGAAQPRRAVRVDVATGMVAVSVRSPRRAGSWIEVMTLVGRNRVRVTRPNVRVHDRSPVWSTDGVRLAFVRDGPVGSGVYTREVGEAVRVRIPLRRDVARFPPLLAWSHSGAAFVIDRWGDIECTLRRPFRHRIAIANLRSRSLREIRLLGSARTHTYVGDYGLSPDGRRLVT
jgi:hypothetical protein